MAKFQKKKIQDFENSNFGNYKEGVGGGGSPQPGDPSKHGHGVNSDHRKANNDTMQPRTNDGKFTYKSVNGQSIDPKYGPSRGKTVNPLLTGGENGIKISDVEQEFSAQSGAIWDKFKDKWYQKGSEYMLLSQGKGHKADWSTRVAGEAIWEVAKERYDKVKGEFQGESKIFEEAKKGKLGKEEQAAKQLAQSTGKEQAVIDQPSGAIKVKPGTVINKILSSPTPTPTSISPSTFAGRGIPNNQNSVGIGASANVGASPITNPNFRKKTETSVSAPQLKHSKEQLQSLRNILIQKGVDANKVNSKSDAELDLLWDKIVEQ